MLLTVFVHSHVEAFFETTGLTLISVRLVYDAVPRARLTSAFENEKGKERVKVMLYSGMVCATL